MIEQRQAPRRTVSDTQVAIVDIESGVAFSGVATNVSGDGLSIVATMEPSVGADMKVTLSGEHAVAGELRVTRVEPRPAGYEIAGRFIEGR